LFTHDGEQTFLPPSTANRWWLVAAGRLTFRSRAAVILSEADDREAEVNMMSVCVAVGNNTRGPQFCLSCFVSCSIKSDVDHPRKWRVYIDISFSSFRLFAWWPPLLFLVRFFLFIWIILDSVLWLLDDNKRLSLQVPNLLWDFV
jgi:hypothetical protein